MVQTIKDGMPAEMIREYAERHRPAHGGIGAPGMVFKEVPGDSGFPVEATGAIYWEKPLSGMVHQSPRSLRESGQT